MNIEGQRALFKGRQMIWGYLHSWTPTSFRNGALKNDGSFDFKNFRCVGKLRSRTLHFCRNFEFSSRNKKSYRHKRKPPTRILLRFWYNHTERLEKYWNRSSGAQFQRDCGTCFERSKHHNVLQRSQCDHYIQLVGSTRVPDSWNGQISQVPPNPDNIWQRNEGLL